MNSIAGYYNNKEQYSPSGERVRRVVQILGNDIKGKKILDIGCGNGTMGKALKEKGAIVFGTDISRNAVEKAAHVLDKAFVLDVDGGDLSVIDSDYDAIIVSEVIEHLFESKKFLLNVKSRMKKDSVLILTTPNFLMWTNRIKMFFGKFEYTETGFLDEGHIHFFTYDSLKKLLSLTGFKIEKENHIIHPKIPHKIGILRPNLFAFQLIIKVKTA
ncbi:MAG: hypothetical protein A2V96_02645 [Candidatus Yonathbacteria bacterium RBG_16_43_6]|uniref:Methyltransferase type 11 domain-containing protein n=1 Tax=Candidatus Yonathbacteria bacterium RIFCSPLOWO2_01_FULL_43_27 TaxID=1802726 RepID=A0A1G2SCI2_9BACT|nr:MAG: hypothetical protein A2V96_02645 [Candidatus Yonathbacteria bacterium RBG_16_43_6]OHA82488.1 MAG: hypothetical protein A3B07_02595 [Candidatus Yonathbacteria bacterium RIFCSPLOWO2_01_FULL_43_27]